MEFGCGYGTVTPAAAEMASGTVHALNIEPETVGVFNENCHQAGIVCGVISSTLRVHRVMTIELKVFRDTEGLTIRAMC